MVRVYRVVLELETPTHVGGGREDEYLTVLKMPIVAVYTNGSTALRWVPVIPKTSLKGVLRATAERIARTLYAGRDDIYAAMALLHHQTTLVEREERRRVDLMVTGPLHTPPDMSIDKVFQYEREPYAIPLFDEKIKEAFKEYVRRISIRLERLARLGLLTPLDRVYEEFASAHCPVCRIFGSSLQGGILHATDLLPENLENTMTQTRSHVAIERGRGIRAARMLYQLEYLSPGTRFTGYIILATPDSSEAKQALDLFNHTIKYINEVGYVTIGGSTSRGYGLARIKINATNHQNKPLQAIRNQEHPTPRTL